MSAPMITPWLPVTVFARVEGAKDVHNDPVLSFGPGVELLACGFWEGANQGQASEIMAAGHERVRVRGFLITPADFSMGPHDRIEVRGRMFEVEGYPQDHTMGPWWNPGLVVWELSRIEGG